MVKPTAVFGGETWAVTEMSMKRQSTWERKILRRMPGPVVEQGQWRIRTDEEMRVLYKVVDIVADVKKKILEWIGHVQVVIMDQGRTLKKVFGSELEGSGRRGRSRLRWLEDVEKDLCEIRRQWTGKNGCL